jgi:hypothetical protein
LSLARTSASAGSGWDIETAGEDPGQEQEDDKHMRGKHHDAFHKAAIGALVLCPIFPCAQLLIAIHIDLALSIHLQA